MASLLLLLLRCLEQDVKNAPQMQIIKIALNKPAGLWKTIEVSNTGGDFRFIKKRLSQK